MFIDIESSPLPPFEGAEDNQALLPLKNHSAPSNGAGKGVGLRSIDISLLRGATFSRTFEWPSQILLKKQDSDGCYAERPKIASGSTRLTPSLSAT